MKVESYKCDGCGKMKGETNHWWIMYASRDLDNAPMFQIYTWPSGTPSDGVKHICSQECAIKTISEWLGAQ